MMCREVGLHFDAKLIMKPELSSSRLFSGQPRNRRLSLPSTDGSGHVPNMASSNMF